MLYMSESGGRWWLLDHRRHPIGGVTLIPVAPVGHRHSVGASLPTPHGVQVKTAHPPSS